LRLQSLLSFVRPLALMLQGLAPGWFVRPLGFLQAGAPGAAPAHGRRADWMWSGVRESLGRTITAVARLPIAASIALSAYLQWLQGRAARPAAVTT
jgi:hypothetical protein